MDNTATKENLSIVHVIDRLYTGGAEKVLVTLANIFHLHGHKVKVVTIAERGPLAAQLLPGIERVNLGRRFKYDIVKMYRLIQGVQGFNVVHVHSFYNLRYLWLAKMLFGLKRPVFYHEHFGAMAGTQAGFWQKAILPKIVFIATTQQINHWAAAIPGMPAGKVFTLPNIILPEGFREPERLPGTVCKLVLVSNIRSEKNIEFGINLLKHLNQAGNKYNLTIIGKLYNTAYYERLQVLVEETGTENAIAWVRDADSVQQLLAQFDVGLHTSASESGPLAVIEYLAQGLPFVAYNTGEVITTIKPELENCVAISFNPEEWQKKIQKLLEQDRPALKQQLQDVFQKHFSAEAYYKKCLEIYAHEKPTATTPSAP